MIEWFLSPKTDQERSIQYAMRLYGIGKISDQVVDYYLQKNDKNLDRKLKQLQGKKLATEQGLYWKDYTSDDAMDHGFGTAAVKYGLDLSKDAKFPFPIPNTNQKSLLARMAEIAKQGLGFQYDAQEHTIKSLSNLMKGAKKGTMIARYL